jgi:hypothetical protein
MPDTDTIAATDEVSEHTRAVALPMALLLGMFGAHRFYVGKTGTGLLMAFTLGGVAMWWLYDIILILAGEFRDREGRRVVKWFADSPALPQRSPRGSEAEGLLQEVQALRAELAELGERVDFMERLLVRFKESSPLPPGPKA